MADYISREAAIEALENSDADVCEQYPDGYCDWGFGRETVESTLKNVPAADVEPVRHGRWVDKKGGFWDVAKCSVCGSPCPTAGIPPRYCPNCGAKMDLEDENEQPGCSRNLEHICVEGFCGKDNKAASKNIDGLEKRN